MKNKGVHIGVAGFGLWGAHGASEEWLQALESGRSAVTMHRFGDEHGASAMPFAAVPAALPDPRQEENPLGFTAQIMVSAAREALVKTPPLPTKLYIAAQQGGGCGALVDGVAQFFSHRANLVGVEHCESSDVLEVGRLFQRALGDLRSGSTQRILLGVLHRGVEPQNVDRLRARKSLAATPARAMSFVHGHEGLAPADACGFLAIERDGAETGFAAIGGVEVGTWSKKEGRRAALGSLVSENQMAMPDIVFVSGTRNSRDDKELLDAVKEAFGGLLVPMRSLDDIGGYAGGAGVTIGLSAAARALSSGILSKRKSARAGVVVLDVDADAMITVSLTRSG